MPKARLPSQAEQQNVKLRESAARDAEEKAQLQSEIWRLNHQVEAQCFQIETLQQQENNTLKLAQETEAKGRVMLQLEAAKAELERTATIRMQLKQARQETAELQAQLMGDAGPQQLKAKASHSLQEISDLQGQQMVFQDKLQAANLETSQLQERLFEAEGERETLLAKLTEAKKDAEACAIESDALVAKSTQEDKAAEVRAERNHTQWATACEELMEMQKRLSAAEAEVQAADSAAKETAFVALSLAELQEKYKALKIQYASEIAELQEQLMGTEEQDAIAKLKTNNEAAAAEDTQVAELIKKLEDANKEIKDLQKSQLAAMDANSKAKAAATAQHEVAVQTSAGKIGDLQKQLMGIEDQDAKLKANNMLLREELAELQNQNLNSMAND